MRWPDIFFKAKKPRPEPVGPPPFTPAPEAPKPVAAEVPPQPQPPTVKPVPAALSPQTTQAITLPQEKRDASPVGTHTLPAMHGVVLRPPTRSSTTTNALPPIAVAGTGRATAPLKNIEQLMAEADPVSTLNQTGNIRLLKKVGAETAPLKPAEPVPVKSAAATPVAVTPVPKPVAVIPPSAPWNPPPFPAFKPASTTVPGETKPPHPLPVAKAPISSPGPVAPPTPGVPVPPTVSAPVPAPTEADSPFILKPATANTPKVIPPPPPPTLKPMSLPVGGIFRRKAKLTDLAKIVLPPKREDTQPLHPPGATSPTVVPSAFPVAAMTARATQVITMAKPRSSALSESAPIAKVASEAQDDSVKKADPVISAPEAKLPQMEKLPEIAKEPEKPAVIEATPVVEPKPPAPVPDLHIDPEAHKPEPTDTPQPKVDPEAHKPDPTPAPSTASSNPTPQPEKREFHLANGERVAGVVLSETPEAIYLQHGTLGVITLPRAQIAKRLVEIILINGDRIVGDIMAETADTLYVRHASLGMLTVPRAQRSTRVVEAILKDGDRILGEVLTETDTFTVIRSATLGTITVPHDKVTMLNRKIEQIELKSLPPPAPELKDKPA